jgi:hypothetical protein
LTGQKLELNSQLVSFLPSVTRFWRLTFKGEQDQRLTMTEGEHQAEMMRIRGKWKCPTEKCVFYTHTINLPCQVCELRLLMLAIQSVIKNIPLVTPPGKS